MESNCDILIKNGSVIDPDRECIEKRDIAILNGRFITMDDKALIRAEQIIDAKNMLIMPGLIDNHTHIYQGGSELGFVPDTALLPMGVTTAIDAGSTGTANFEAFFRTIIIPSQMKIFCNLNIASSGQVTEKYNENLNPKKYDAVSIKFLLEKYKSYIKGIKLRCDKNVVDKYGLATLYEAKAIARKNKTFLVVHVTNPPDKMEAIVRCLDRGDIVCHCYQGISSTIINDKNIIKADIEQARKKGVIFDSADARGNHEYKVLLPAVKNSFWPDIISTDMTRESLWGDMLYGLPVVMSKYLSLGMPIIELVKACTKNPAEALGIYGKVGSLREDASADIAIFKLAHKKITYHNRAGETFQGNQLLIPQWTILDGKVVYRNIETL